MLLRRSAEFITILILAAGLVVLQPVETPASGDLAAVWKDYTVARKRFHYDLARLVTDERPELGGVAGLQRDLQFALIELNNLRFHYLIEHAPERLVLDHGLETFARFEWTEDDSEALRELEPDYAKLERWVDKFTKELSDHPDLPEAEQCIFALHHNDYYRSMVERYHLRLTDIESALRLVARAR